MTISRKKIFGFKLWTLLASFVLALFFSSFGDTDDQREKEKFLLMFIMQSLQEMHYEPQKVDDEYSQKVFDLYMNRLDVNKRFFLKEDINTLARYKTQIDDQIKNSSFEFFNTSTDLMQKRFDEAQQYYRDALSKPFNYTKNETIELDADKLDFAASKAELKDRWRKQMKYETLQRVATSVQIQEEAKEKSDTTVKQKSVEQLEKESRERTLKVYDDYFDRLSKMERSDRLAIYLNSIVNVYDPHTEYYAPKDKEDFDIAMSGQLEGIGAQLQEKDGEIKVTNIVPGSASYRQGELKVGDVIMKVAQGKEEPVDVVGMPLDKAVQLIRGKKGTEVRLTVKKPEGGIKIIPIIRDIVVLEETYAKSAIIEENGKKIGYIKLPSFYADFANPNGRSSGEDVKQEVLKLKDDNVDGIILDLRNNGGGSLEDVVNMAGLFIDQGPVVQVKTSIGKPQVLSDREKGTVYDGPLVVLVNSLSASASEILAAALQDYNRAIVIGSTSTFGKGSVQRFFELDNYLAPAYKKLGPLGSLKITLQKFYRINGESTQLKGVVPDIIVPDPYEHLEIREKNHDYPMPWDKIEGLDYNLYTIAHFDKIKSSSQKRIDENKDFQLIKEQSERPLERKANSAESLQMDAFLADKKEEKQEGKKFEAIGKSLPEITIVSLSADVASLESDSTKMNMQKDWFKNMQKDPYIYEAMQVIEQMK